MEISSFHKNILKVFTGTAISQFIPILISPILARIYNPEEFGRLTLFLSILAIGTTIVNGKYDIGIYIPDNEEDTIEVVQLNLLVSFLISFLILLLFIIFDNFFIITFKLNSIGIWLYISPFIIFFIGIYKTFYSYLNKLENYYIISVSKIFKSIVLSSFQILIGIAGFKTIGLLISQSVGEVAVSFYLFFKTLKRNKKIIDLKKSLNLKKQAIRYKNFPKYSLPADLINNLSNQAPIFIFNNYFGSGMVGQFGFANRILAVPLGLLASAILDVFKQEATKNYIESGTCRPLFISTFKKLVLFSLPIFIILGICSPFLFRTIFGNQWYIAGEYTQILSVLFFIRFVVSPLSYVIYISENQKIDLIWQIILSILTVISIFVGVYFKNIKLSLLLFTISYSLMYLIYLYISYKYTINKNYDRNN